MALAEPTKHDSASDIVSLENVIDKNGVSGTVGDFNEPSTDGTQKLRGLGTRQLVTFAACKWVGALAYRFMFPFAPFLSEELGVSLQKFFIIIAVNDWMGALAGLFSGPLTDSYGPQVVFLVTQFLFQLAYLPNILFVVWEVTLASWSLHGLAFITLSAAIQSTLGMHVPPKDLGRMTGRVETSWALSALLGLPVLGALLNRFGWRAPFAVLAVCSVLSGVLALRCFPHDECAVNSNQIQEKEETNSQSSEECEPESVELVAMQPTPAVEAPCRELPCREVSKGERWRTLVWFVLSGRVSRTVLCCCFLSSAMYGLFNASYGEWMNEAYGLDAEKLGFTTFVLGSAELLGAVLFTFLSHFNPRSTVTGAFCCVAFAFPCLALLSQGSLAYALAGTFILISCFEFLIISTVSFMTLKGTHPAARGTGISLAFTTMSFGRAPGALCAPSVYNAGGIELVGAIGCLVMICASLVFIFGTRFCCGHGVEDSKHRGRLESMVQVKRTQSVQRHESTQQLTI